MRRLLIRLLTLTMLAASTGGALAQTVSTVGNLASTIRFGDLYDQIEGLRHPITVRVTRVSSLAGVRISGERLDRAIAQREGALHSLRRAVRRSRQAMRVLEIHGHTPDQVIWVVGDADDRTAMLFVDDR